MNLTTFGPRASAAALSAILALIAGCDTGATPVASVGLLREGATPPNVIFVVVDTLRADRLGTHGYYRKLTPTIDALAAEGVVCERAVAVAPWTLPSVASLFTATYPKVHKAVSYLLLENMDQGRIGKVSVLDESFDTLAELLQSSGYVTAAFSANKFIKAEYGFGQGFDHFDASFAANRVSGSVVNAAALQWLDQRDAQRPFFMYLHYMDVHGPYDAAPQFMDPLLAEVEANPNRRPLPQQALRMLNPYLNKPPAQDSDPTRWERLRETYDYWEARYDAGVAEFDHHFAAMVAELKKRGVWDNSYVVLTSDHGEALFEHGFWDHGYSLFQTDLHVPLILRWPGVLPTGIRLAGNIELIDIYPTIAEQLRRKLSSTVQGTSFVAHLSGDPKAFPSLAFADAVKAGALIHQQAILRDDWKLLAAPISQKRPDGSTATQTLTVLINLAVDPREQTNALPTHGDVARALADAMKQQIQTNVGFRPGITEDFRRVSEADIIKLRSEGYVGAGGRAAASQPASAPASAESDGE